MSEFDTLVIVPFGKVDYPNRSVFENRHLTSTDFCLIARMLCQEANGRASARNQSQSWTKYRTTGAACGDPAPS